MQLFLVYYGMSDYYHISAFMAGVIVLSLNSSAYTAEIIRSGVAAIDKGQWEAARALHIPKYLIFKDIILPQAIRNILPVLVNEMIDMIRETALISIIGESDIMRRAQIVSSEQLSFFMPLLVAAASYYCLITILGILARKLEKGLKIQ